MLPSASCSRQDARTMALPMVCCVCPWHHAAFDHAAAQHPVQLLQPGGGAGHVGGLDVRQRRHRLEELDRVLGAFK